METFGMFLVLVVVGSSIWVGLDAKQLGIRKGSAPGVLDASPFGWFCFTLLMWLVAFPLYLATRSRFKIAAQQASHRSAHMALTESDLQREADARAAFLADLADARLKKAPPPQIEILSAPVEDRVQEQASPPPDSPLYTAQLLQEILATQRQSAADIRQIRNAIAAAIIFGAIIGIIIALS
jgi:hypothetical protein